MSRRALFVGVHSTEIGTRMMVDRLSLVDGIKMFPEACSCVSVVVSVGSSSLK
jgi:hypothetical protein